MGFGKDVEGRCLFGLEVCGFRKGLADRKKSGKTGLLVLVRVMQGERVEICGSGTERKRVEQMRLKRTKSGRPIGRHEIK